MPIHVEHPGVHVEDDPSTADGRGLDVGVLVSGRQLPASGDRTSSSAASTRATSPVEGVYANITPAGSTDVTEPAPS